MGTTVITSGVDTWVIQPYPDDNRASWAYPLVQAGLRRILVQMPVVVPAGATVLSATLSVPVRGTWTTTESYYVNSIAASWQTSKVTWNNQPDILTGPGTGTTTVIGPQSDGTRVELDVTPLVQAIAAGQANYGWKISTSSTSGKLVYGFDSGHSSWQLEIETSDPTDAPTGLTPEGVVSLGKWVCQIDDVDDLSQIRVLVDPAANSVAPAFDSGWVSTTTPTLDLASTAYAGLADGATTYWCAATKPSTGNASVFSEWVAVTRHVKPTLVMDNPPAGLVYDSTPTIEAHLSAGGSATTRWQVRLLDVTDASKVLYDSGGDIMGATLAHTIPHRWRNKPVIKADGTYRLQVYCWDRSDRVGSYGDQPWLLVDETLTVSTDGTIAAPTGLVVSSVAAGAPDVLLHWSAVADPDYFLAYRDGEKIPVQIDPDDARVAPGVFEWVDATATPNTASTWKIRAVVGTKHSVLSTGVTFSPNVIGIWIRSPLGTVLLRGDDVDNIKQTDKRITYNLPYAFEDVDVITAVSGYAADQVNLTIDNRLVWSPSVVQDVDTARGILEDIRQSPARPVQLVWGTVSIPVYLRGLSVAPNSQMLPTRDRRHNVSFGFFETNDVDNAGFAPGYYGAGTYF